MLMVLLTPLWGIEQGGVVRSGGLPIPGATVTATQGSKQIVTTTDETGRYLFPNLPAGAWKLAVEMFGFSPQTRDLTIGEQASTVDFTLALKPTVEVARAPRPAPERGAGPGGRGGPNGRGGFRNLNLNDTPAEAQQDAAALDAALRPPDAAATPAEGA